MGYSTSHRLQTLPADRYEEVAHEYEQISGYEYLFDDSWSWYDEPEHSRIVSKKFPGVVIAIIGDGEEQGDIWRSVYYNGELIETLKPEPFQFPPLAYPATACPRLEENEE